MGCWVVGLWGCWAVCLVGCWIVGLFCFLSTNMSPNSCFFFQISPNHCKMHPLDCWIASFIFHQNLPKLLGFPPKILPKSSQKGSKFNVGGFLASFKEHKGYSEWILAPKRELPQKPSLFFNHFEPPLGAQESTKNLPETPPCDRRRCCQTELAAKVI